MEARAAVPAVASPRGETTASGNHVTAKPATIDSPGISGPLTRVEMVRWGGYKSTDGMGTFFTVMKVDGTGSGVARGTFELLDQDGKVVKTFTNSFNVGKGTGMTKVSTTYQDVPSSVKRIRYRITHNEARTHFEDGRVVENSVKTFAKNGHMWVSGKVGKNTRGYYDGVHIACFDANGVPAAGSTAVNGGQGSTGDFATFEYMLDVPDTYKPSQCYASSNV